MFCKRIFVVLLTFFYQSAFGVVIPQGNDEKEYLEYGKNFSFVVPIFCTYAGVADSESASGTGSLTEIDDRQAILTAAHVLRDAEQAIAILPARDERDVGVPLLAWDFCPV